MTDIPTPPSVPPQNWFARNWKWLVPSGCLVIFLSLLAFAGAIVFFVGSAMKQSDAYKTALARAKENPSVIAALGTPIKDGLIVSGSTNVSGPAGESNLAIPISGPKGKATIYVVARKSAGIWMYDKLVVELAATKQRIDLNTH